MYVIIYKNFNFWMHTIYMLCVLLMQRKNRSIFHICIFLCVYK